MLTRTFNKTLTRSGNNNHSYLVPDFKGNAATNISQFRLMTFVDFVPFIQLKKF